MVELINNFLDKRNDMNIVVDLSFDMYFLFVVWKNLFRLNFIL